MGYEVESYFDLNYLDRRRFAYSSEYVDSLVRVLEDEYARYDDNAGPRLRLERYIATGRQVYDSFQATTKFLTDLFNPLNRSSDYREWSEFTGRLSDSNQTRIITTRNLYQDSFLNASSDEAGGATPDSFIDRIIAQYLDLIDQSTYSEDGRGFNDVLFDQLYDNWLDNAPSPQLAQVMDDVVNQYRSAFPTPDLVNGLQEIISENNSRRAPTLVRGGIQRAVAEYLRENQVLDTYLYGKLVNGNFTPEDIRLFEIAIEKLFDPTFLRIGAPEYTIGGNK